MTSSINIILYFYLCKTLFKSIISCLVFLPVQRGAYNSIYKKFCTAISSRWFVGGWHWLCHSQIRGIIPVRFSDRSRALILGASQLTQSNFRTSQIRLMRRPRDKNKRSKTAINTEKKNRVRRRDSEMEADANSLTVSNCRVFGGFLNRLLVENPFFRYVKRCAFCFESLYSSSTFY